jgi:hypothetical protein
MAWRWLSWRQQTRPTPWLGWPSFLFRFDFFSSSSSFLSFPFVLLLSFLSFLFFFLFLSFFFLFFLSFLLLFFIILFSLFSFFLFSGNDVILPVSLSNIIWFLYYVLLLLADFALFSRIEAVGDLFRRERARFFQWILQHVLRMPRYLFPFRCADFIEKLFDFAICCAFLCASHHLWRCQFIPVRVSVCQRGFDSFWIDFSLRHRCREYWRYKQVFLLTSFVVTSSPIPCIFIYSFLVVSITFGWFSLVAVAWRALRYAFFPWVLHSVFWFLGWLFDSVCTRYLFANASDRWTSYCLRWAAERHFQLPEWSRTLWKYPKFRLRCVTEPNIVFFIISPASCL